MTGKQFRILALLTTFALVLTALVIAQRMWRDHMDRLYAFAPYANALSYYIENFGACPQTIVELEKAYNAYELRVVPQLPVPPNHRRPTYRPLVGLKRGSYLTFVESAPGGFLGRRWVLYASPDAEILDRKQVWIWDLDELIAEDDKLRSASDRAITGD